MQWEFISEKHRALYEVLSAGRPRARRAGRYWVFSSGEVAWVVGYDGVRRGHFVHVLPGRHGGLHAPGLSEEAVREWMGYDTDCEPCSPYVPGRYRVHGDVVLEVAEAARERHGLCEAVAREAGETYRLLLREALLRWAALTISSTGLPARVSGDKVVVSWPDCFPGTPCHAEPHEAAEALARYLTDAAQSMGRGGLRAVAGPGPAPLAVEPAQEPEDTPAFEEEVTGEDALVLEVTAWPKVDMSPEIWAAYREAMEAIREACAGAGPGEVAGNVYRHEYVLKPAVEVRARLRMRFPGLGLGPVDQDFVHVYAIPGARLRIEHPDRPVTEVAIASAAVVRLRSLYAPIQAEFFVAWEVATYEP